MQSKDSFVISIKDNGTGFDIEEVKQTKHNHFGLKVMQERIELLGGTFHMKSIIGEGTKIVFDIPNKSLEGDQENEY